MASSTLPGEIDSLAAAIHNTVNIVPESQIRERLQILEAWFGSIPQARAALSNSLVLELGCGQGDFTATLSGLASAKDELKILAVDPGALDYGSPITLGEAQDIISKTPLGEKIEWIQAESVDFIAKLKKEGRVPDYVILAHSLFYLPSETYLSELLAALREPSSSSSKRTTLLLAEWGMRATHPSAEAHIAAVKAQAEMKIPDGNIRTLFYPESVNKIASGAEWKVESEQWIVPEEDVDDGCWEVATAKVLQKEGWRDEEKESEEMEKAAVERVRSMDVWCGVFQC